MSDTKIQKDAFRHVEAELYAYPYRKREIERLRREILYPYQPTDENIGGGKGNLPGNPTAKVALTLASHSRLLHLERTIDVIDETYGQFPEVKREFIRVKYWAKPQTLTTVGICRELGISERTFTRWRKDLVINIAEKLGWK